ncbi:MAG: ATP-dependent metallopeptidase FtsH/Yme1/Tma family protein, partial [Bacteroidales bacterium]|nr:ATP-dependent metallopeptidase FtsH/Yme1/Tma family protein [Bacteroidales bacterium]
MANSQNPQMPGNGRDPKMPKFNLNWIYIVIIGALAVMLYQGNQNPGSFDKEVSYSEMKKYIAQDYTSEVTVDKTEGLVHLVIKPEKIREVFKKGVEEVGKRPTVSTRYPSADKVEDYLTKVDYKGKVRYEETRSFWLNLLSSLFPIVFLVGLWWFMMRRMGGMGGGGGIFSVGKSKAKEYDK